VDVDNDQSRQRESALKRCWAIRPSLTAGKSRSRKSRIDANGRLIAYRKRFFTFDARLCRNPAKIRYENWSISNAKEMPMVNFKSGLVCAAFLGLFALTGTASAMPVGQLGSDVNAATPQTDIQKVRWVCGPYGNCVWRPNYYAPYPYPYYGYGYGYYPRPRYYGYGYYGPRWRRW
jgi:hypothetical protein